MATYTDGLNGASLIDCAGTATSVTTAPVAGGVLYGATGSTVACTAAGTAGQIFTSNGAAAPSWQAAGVAHWATLAFNSGSNIANNQYITQSALSANLSDGILIIPRAGTITNIYVGYINATTGVAVPPGGGSSRTATLYYGSGTATPTTTGITVTVTGAASAGSVALAKVVAAGDRIAILHTSAGAPSAAQMLASIVIV